MLQDHRGHLLFSCKLFLRFSHLLFGSSGSSRSSVQWRPRPRPSRGQKQKTTRDTIIPLAPLSLSSFLQMSEFCQKTKAVQLLPHNRRPRHSRFSRSSQSLVGAAAAAAASTRRTRQNSEAASAESDKKMRRDEKRLACFNFFIHTLPVQPQPQPQPQPSPSPLLPPLFDKSSQDKMKTIISTRLSFSLYLSNLGFFQSSTTTTLLLVRYHTMYYHGWQEQTHVHFLSSDSPPASK